MPRRPISPIRDTYDTWPLANNYHLRWGADENGEMWVAVENPQGECEGVLAYDKYLEHERSRAGSLPVALPSEHELE